MDAEIAAQVGKAIGAILASAGLYCVPIIVLSYFGWSFSRNPVIRKVSWVVFWIASILAVGFILIFPFIFAL